jgi:phage shock protein A
MSKLEEAINRLDAASDRLETSLTAALGRGGSAEMLASELAAAKRDYAALTATTDEVSSKLDATIGRLKFVLDS